MVRSATAANIKRIITAKGLKQSFVAEKAGYPYKQFSAMLRGRHYIHDYDVLAISKALGVSTDELF